MKRAQRLQAGKTWIKTYKGKNILHGYRNHFGVDILCALKELPMIGVSLKPDYVDQVVRSRDRLLETRGAKKQERISREPNLPFESDINVYFIAGYTSGGFPYGITWKEAHDQGLLDEVSVQSFE